MVQATSELRVPPPFPATTESLLAQRKIKHKRSINDLIEDLIIRLHAQEDQMFLKLLNPIYDSETSEGSLDIEDFLLATHLRDVAKKNEIIEIADKRLDTIIRAMKVALRRLRLDREYRYEHATGANGAARSEETAASA